MPLKQPIHLLQSRPYRYHPIAWLALGLILGCLSTLLITPRSSRLQSSSITPPSASTSTQADFAKLILLSQGPHISPKFDDHWFNPSHASHLLFANEPWNSIRLGLPDSENPDFESQVLIVKIRSLQTASSAFDPHLITLAFSSLNNHAFVSYDFHDRRLFSDVRGSARTSSLHDAARQYLARTFNTDVGDDFNDWLNVLLDWSRQHHPAN